MARGRSLIWLAGLLSAAAGVSWLAKEFDTGPRSVHLIWAPLAAVATAALLTWILFYVAARALRRRKPEAARSVVHLQTVATALLAIIAVASVTGGLQSALVGLGLLGFGLTLALQRPILAVAGWASLVLGGAVKVGDRIRVGELAGDVLDITLLSTRLWEVGEPSSSSPGRPTGRVVTLSNAVFLEQPVANATSDTPMVFDEFVVNVAFEADLQLAQDLLAKIGQETLDIAAHSVMARTYRKLTKGLAMEADFPDHPIILAESKPSWMEYRLRYLVDARRAGRTQAKLTTAWTAACLPFGQELPQVYPRTQPQPIDATGRAVAAPSIE